MAFTPIFGTGFETGSTNSPMAGNAISSGCTISTIYKKTGSYSICGGTGDGFQVNIGNLGYSLSEIYAGLWFYPYAESGGVSGTIFKFILSDSKTIDFRADNLFYKLYINNILVATSALSFVVGSWHNVQIHLSVADSGGRAELCVDGGLAIDYTGDTKPSTGTTISSFYVQNLGGNAGASSYLDDISIGINGWPGDIRYDSLRPNADTLLHSWLPNGVSLQSAPLAPTVGISGASGITGTYRYKVSLVDADGTSLASVASDVVTPSSQTVNLTNIALGLDGTTARKIYRTANGGSIYKLLTTISDNVTTIYNDAVADGSLGVGEPANVHYTQVDEVGPNDGDYIYTATNSNQDLFTLTDWDATRKTPLYVVQWLRALKGTADLQKIKMLLQSGATLNVSSEIELLTTAQYLMRILTIDPNTSTPWTNESLDGLQVGVEAVVP